MAVERVTRLTSAGAGSTRAAAVAEELRRMIMAGELKAGTRLRQVELAAQFDVSTTPVREAFVLLARAGLVRHDVQRGVVVFSPTVDDVRENYEIRISLEPLATERAAEHITSEQLARLDDVICEMRNSREFPEYQRLNREFHRIIYEAADRPRLLQIIESLRDSFEAFIHLDVSARPDQRFNDAAHDQHEAIARALQARDGVEAKALMHHHLTDNAEHYMASSAELAGTRAAAG